MKITKRQLRRIIKEEKARLIEMTGDVPYRDDVEAEERLLDQVHQGEKYNLETDIFKLLDTHNLSIEMLKKVLTVIDDRQG
jgi:hypothetical protein|tara:strand:+ start:116 stop:358 length:243 start_codon:yes stop_codon:yes gene_type:complete